jgi:hypothetical protein
MWLVTGIIIYFVLLALYAKYCGRCKNCGCIREQETTFYDTTEKIRTTYITCKECGLIKSKTTKALNW